MKIRYKGMTVIVTKNYEEMSRKAAGILAAQVTIKPESVLGLATGSTPEGMYSELVELIGKGAVDFTDVHSFNLDEYYPIQPDNEQSYAYYMNEHFFQPAGLRTEQYNVPDGTVKEVGSYCKAYDDMIESAGGIDFQVLGIGNNGHIGFNEPDVHFESSTHLVTLDEETIIANSRFFEKAEDVPKTAISMGIKTIMHSKKILLLASGASKAEAVAEMILGDITPNLPASILQLHNDVTIVLDEEAAKLFLSKVQEEVA